MENEMLTGATWMLLVVLSGGSVVLFEPDHKFSKEECLKLGQYWAQNHKEVKEIYPEAIHGVAQCMSSEIDKRANHETYIFNW
jgi:hypothetical protein